MGEKYEIVVRTQVDDSIQKFRLVYDQTAGAENAQSCKNAITSWIDGCLAELQNILALDTRVLSVYCRKLSGDKRPTWRENLVTKTGSRTGQAISSQNCLIINLRNAAGNLKRPGRVFISGCSIDDIEQLVAPTGGWSAALLDPPVTDFATAIRIVPAGGGSDWEGALNVEQYQQNTPNPPTYTYQVVDSIDATIEPGTRMGRKGRDTGID